MTRTKFLINVSSSCKRTVCNFRDESLVHHNSTEMKSCVSLHTHATLNPNRPILGARRKFGDSTGVRKKGTRDVRRNGGNQLDERGIEGRRSTQSDTVLTRFRQRGIAEKEGKSGSGRTNGGSNEIPRGILRNSPLRVNSLRKEGGRWSVAQVIRDDPPRLTTSEEDRATRSITCRRYIIYEQHPSCLALSINNRTANKQGNYTEL